MAKRKISDIPCSVEGCALPSVCRGYCNPHYQRVYHYGDPTKGRRPVGAVPPVRCTVDGCDALPRSAFSKYCELHNARLRRNGHFDKVMEAHRVEHTGGYVLIPARGHPMATESHRSHAYEHRVVFFDAYGHGPHACHVCGRSGMLADMHVDHLNEVRDDNRLANLKPACPPCNQWRGKSRVEVARKRRTTKLLTFNGETLSASEWARRLGIAPGAIGWRMKAGWPLERALTEPRGVTGPQRKRA